MSPMNNRILRPLAVPGVLDFAPGAAAAYSLRNLSLSYAGPVVTVRRSTDNAEADFTASEVSDGTLAAWCSGGDGFVKQWWSQTGSNHVSQSTAGYQPQLIDAGSLITEGGKAAVRFDGVNDYLSNGSNVWGRNGVLPFWIFSVANTNTEASGVGTIAATRKTSSPFDGWQFRCNSGTTGALFVVDYNGSVGDGVFSSLDLRDQQAIAVCTLDGTPEMYVNGADDSSSPFNDLSSAYSPSITTLNIGATGTTASAADHLKGTLQEFLLYYTDMTALRQRIEGNINRHFGIF